MYVVRHHTHNFVGFFNGVEPNISEAEGDVCFDFSRYALRLRTYEESPQSELLVLLCSVEMLRIIAICKRPMNIT